MECCARRTSHKDWATTTNSILVSSNGKEDAEDGIFFKKGNPFNQGQIYTFDDDEVVTAMELAEGKAKYPNTEGEKLKDDFTYEKTVDKLLEEMSNDIDQA